MVEYRKSFEKRLLLMEENVVARKRMLSGIKPPVT